MYTSRGLKALFIIQGANGVFRFQITFCLFAIMDHAEENEIKVVEFNSYLSKKNHNRRMLFIIYLLQMFYTNAVVR